MLGPHGFPTVLAEVATEAGHTGSALVPWGASVGKYEAKKLYDGGDRYKGYGVRRAVDNINEVIGPRLAGMPVTEQRRVDTAMLELDGTPDKSNLGANAMLPVSLAVARAAAASLGIPLYRYLGGFHSRMLPVVMFNVIGGGGFYNPHLTFEDYLLVPVGFDRFGEAVEAVSSAYFALGDLLRAVEPEVNTRNGVYIPRTLKNDQVFAIMLEAVAKAGYEGRIVLGVDVCANHFFREEEQRYALEGSLLTRDEMMEVYQRLRKSLPLLYVEDPLHEDDFEGLARLTGAMGRTVLCGDDIFASQTNRLSVGIRHGAGNSVLLKVDQVGTLSEAWDTAALALHSHYSIVVSMRSRDTTDSFIADLAVGVGAEMMKVGPPILAERTEKINRLLAIERELGADAGYRGRFLMDKYEAVTHG